MTILVVNTLTDDNESLMSILFAKKRIGTRLEDISEKCKVISLKNKNAISSMAIVLKNIK